MLITARNHSHHIARGHQRQECAADTTRQFCIIVERESQSSRYIEIAHDTSWTDSDACTQCSCSSNGHLTCRHVHERCTRSCLLHKKRPVSIMYFFPSGSQWFTPSTEPCRSCQCVHGQRTCTHCDRILEIDIDTTNLRQQNNQPPSRPAIGEYHLLPVEATLARAMPCLLQINEHSHRLIYPGQQTWFEQRCYFCSQENGRLLTC